MARKVLDCAADSGRVVVEFAEGPVALEAQNSADRARGVVVIDVIGDSLLAQRAEEALLVDQSDDFSGRDPVASA